MTIYRIGTGISNITDSAVGMNMQGMADPGQKITGVETSLYARAFVILDEANRCVAIVNADIWAGTARLKAEVITRLRRYHPGVYAEQNVLISGTHTHSAAGGYSDYSLYENVAGGFDPHTFECIVSGMVTAVRNAHGNLAPGRIYINTGTIDNCGSQRSALAYRNNPPDEQKKYGSETDKEMLLLKFVALQNGMERPIGALNWYAIHPTDRGQTNTLQTGDHKGYASSLFEAAMGTNYKAQNTFVAAFANSNCGDVSGNVDYGTIPDGVHDHQHMQEHGNKQYKKAKELFDNAKEELQGGIAYRHTRVDMSNVSVKDGLRTWPGGLGLSFAAGSTEDSIPRIPIGPVTVDSFKLREGIVEDNVTVAERAEQLAIIGALGATFGATDIPPEDFKDGHLPKPLVFAPGLLDPPATPNVLPLQIIQIGNLVLLAIPGEITTMAGRRLREALLAEFSKTVVNHIALATYANDYSQYITTEEEYKMQHYEGASTLFGPHTLAAYEKKFRELAIAIKNREPVDSGPVPSKPSVPPSGRITIRNYRLGVIKLAVYDQNDGLMWMPYGDKKELPERCDGALYVPFGECKIQINDSDLVQHIRPGDLVIIQEAGSGFVTSYDPPYAPFRRHKARSAALGSKADGRLELLFVQMDGRNSIYHAEQTKAGTWMEPTAIDGIAKDISVERNAGGQLEMFYSGMDGYFYHVQQEDGSWGKHSRLGGQGQSIVVGTNADGRLEIFYLGVDGKTIYQAWQTAPNGKWSDHRSFGVEGKNIAVGLNASGRLEMFYAGMDDYIYHAWQEAPNGSWSDPVQFGGQAKNIAVGLNASGLLEMFYAGMNDDYIYHACQKDPKDPKVQWSNHVQFGDSRQAKRISVRRDSKDCMHVFYVGMDDLIYHTLKEKDGDWSADKTLVEI